MFRKFKGWTFYNFFFKPKEEDDTEERERLNKGQNLVADYSHDMLWEELKEPYSEKESFFFSPKADPELKGSGTMSGSYWGL